MSGGPNPPPEPPPKNYKDVLHMLKQMERNEQENLRMNLAIQAYIEKEIKEGE